MSEDGKFKINKEEIEKEIHRIKGQAAEMVESLVSDLTHKMKDFANRKHAGSNTPTEVANNLEKFATLHKNGVLDDKEFADIKKKLLSKL